MNWAHRAGRVLAIVGALGIWVPFAALAGMGIRAALSSPGLAVPLSWAPMMRPEYSEPLHLLTRLGVLFGAVTALGGLLMFEWPARREHASHGQGRVSTSSAAWDPADRPRAPSRQAVDHRAFSRWSSYQWRRRWMT